jgi:HD-GYP domain-containing protein (c-di-GMP phosphodiesterase class II)
VDAQQRHALQALDAVAIAAMMARRLSLSADQTRELTLATLLHGVGLLRLPANLRVESGLTRAAEVQAYRQISGAWCGSGGCCSGMPPAVGHIIANHRERLERHRLSFPEGR